MPSYLFDITTPVNFNQTGKFEAPSSEWMHTINILEDFELIIVTKGILYLKYQNVKYAVSPGQHLLLKPSTPLNRYCQENLRQGYKQSNCSFYWLHFACNNMTFINDIDKNVPEADGKALKIPIQDTLSCPEKVLLLMRQLQDCVRSSYDNNYYDYMTTLILCELNNQYLASEQVKALKHKTYSNKQLYNDIVDYINYYINENLKVNQIAKHFGFNEKYLSLVFKKNAGITLKQYCMNLKIEKANFLLNDTNMTVASIATALGFPDNHNFMRTYKLITGMTPSEYRNLYSKRILNHN